MVWVALVISFTEFTLALRIIRRWSARYNLEEFMTSAPMPEIFRARGHLILGWTAWQLALMAALLR